MPKNMDKQDLCVRIHIRYMPKSGTAGSCGRVSFSFLRNRHTDFRSGYTSLHSHRQWINFLPSLHPCQHLLSFVFIDLSYSAWGKMKSWSSFKLHFFWWLRMWTTLRNTSWWFEFILLKTWFGAMPQYIFGLFVFLVFSFLSYLCIVDTGSYQMYCWEKLFHSVGFFKQWCVKAKSSIRSHVSIVSLNACSTSPCASKLKWIPHFLLCQIQGIGSMLRSLTHLVLSFVLGER